MTAPVAERPPVSPSLPDSSSLEAMTDRITSDDFIAEVVRDYETGAPDKNKMVPQTEEHATIGDFGETGGKDAPVKQDAKVPDGAPEKGADGKPAEPRKLATEFSLIGADGDELDVNDVMGQVAKVAFTYKGEQREMPLDRVVRLAQSGIHNEDLYTKATEAIGHFDTLEQEVERGNQSITKQNRFIEKLLTDDDFRAQIQDQYAQHNTPEARAERAERRATELEARLAGRSQSETGASFFQGDVLPSLTALLTQYPTLTQDEVTGAFNRMTAKFGPVVDPKHYAAVRAILKDDLPAYAAGLHESRADRDKSKRETAEKMTLLKRRVAQGARPTGRRATADELKPRQKAPRTDDERLDNMIDRALA